MKTKISMVFTVLLIAVMLGVVFGILTNSRNSILVKEMIYVAGGSLAAIIAALFIFLGKPCYKERIPLLSLGSVAGVLVLMTITHFTNRGSVNGPFTFLMLLSLSSLIISALLFVDKAHFRIFISLMLGASSLMFLYAVLQWLGVNLFSWDAALTRSGRSTGTLGNPNLLGGFASAVIPLGIAFLHSSNKYTKTIKTILSIAFVIVAVTAIVASGTRGSLIGVCLGCLFLLLWHLHNSGKSFKQVIPFVLLFVLVVSAVALPMASRLSELDPDAENQGTLQVRKVIWSGAFNLFTQSPVFGHGPGSFQILFPEFRDPSYSILGVSHNTLHAHCEYLEILVDLGIVGFAVWALAIWGLIPFLRNANLLQAGAFAGVVAMLGEAAVSVHLRWPPTAWLFATLVLIFLLRKSEAVNPGRKIKIAAIALLATSLILAAGFFTHYLPLSRSSELVFKGKDMYLAKTEIALNGAHSAAIHWSNSGDPGALNAAVGGWQNAYTFADSAVYYSREASEAYPSDLGAWYALGSAYLTRYMVMDSPVPAMTSALQTAGLDMHFTQQELRNELLSGMAAYDSLRVRAPNYAEVHNNLALGYSNLGMIDESMMELYAAYKIHGHRREDYFQQVLALITINPDSYEGALLYFHHIAAAFDLESSGRRLEKNYASVLQNAWFLTAIQPQNTDALIEEFCSICSSILPEENSSYLIGELRRIEELSPFSAWDSGEILGMTDQEAIESIEEIVAQAAFSGKAFPTAMPSDASLYRLPAELLFHSNWDPAIYDSAMQVFLLEILIDRNLDDVHSLISSSRFHSFIDSSVAEKIFQIRLSIGGSRTALREGYEMPWLPGTLPALISDSLHSGMASDSLNSNWYQMELRMNFLLVTSYWWDYNIFASAQNQYLLDRIFFCRDKIRELDSSSWNRTVSLILDREIERISLFTDAQCPPTVGLLRDDLVSGADRVLN